MKRLALTLLLCLAAVAAAAKQKHDGYILRLDAKRQMASLDLDTFVAVERSLRAPVLWAQRDGQRWEIRDPSILARAAEAIGPVTKINEEYEAFRRRAKPVYQEEEDLDHKLDAAEDAEPPDEARLPELRAQQRELAPRLRAVEAEEDELDARQQRAEAVAERIIDNLIEEAMRNGLAVKSLVP
jgi:chromosome segregation ATPase